MRGEHCVSYRAGVDYLRITFTQPGYEDTALPHYISAASFIARELYGGEAATTAWQWKGYKGAATGSVSWGAREDGCILQVSGAAASRAAMLQLPYTGVPRLDIQITTWGEASPGTIPRGVAVASDRARKCVAGRPWAVRLQDTYGDGDTAYLGSRSSAWFVRVYDKHKESKQEQYAGAVRYEAELHNETAEAVYGAIAGRELQDEEAARIVAGYLLLRGIDLGAVLQTAVIAADRTPREPTSTERTLQWLSEAVAPSVARLIGQGVAPGALRALLGLDLPRATGRGRGYVSREAHRTRRDLRENPWRATIWANGKEVTETRRNQHAT